MAIRAPDGANKQELLSAKGCPRKKYLSQASVLGLLRTFWTALEDYGLFWALMIQSGLK